MNDTTRRRRARRTVRHSILAATAGALLLLVAGSATPSTAAADEIVFRSHRDGGTQDLYVVRRDGSGLRRLTHSQDFERAPRWSPDGSMVAFSALRDGNWDVYVVARDGTGLTRVTDHPDRDDTPTWTADGKILFARGPFECPCDLYVAEPDGSGEQRLPLAAVGGGGVDASRHGRRVAFSRDGAIWISQLDGQGLRRLTTPPAGAQDGTPRFAPSGNDVVFQRWDGAQHDLYVVGATGQPLRRLTDTPRHLEQFPSWTRSGDEVVVSRIALADFEQSLWAVRLDGGGETRLSTALRAPVHVDFDRDGVDGSLWHEVADGSGATIRQAGGRLELAFAADATPGGPWNVISRHVGLQCGLPGDFDLSVRYELLEWPEANGTQAELAAFFANAHVGRESRPWGEQHYAWLDGTGGTATHEERRGAIRLVRTDGRVKAYWRHEGVWVPIRSAPANPATVTPGLALRAFGGHFAGRPVRVAFDDFRIASGELACPGWWNAVMGDVAPGG